MTKPNEKQLWRCLTEPFVSLILAIGLNASFNCQCQAQPSISNSESKTGSSQGASSVQNVINLAAIGTRKQYLEAKNKDGKEHFGIANPKREITQDALARLLKKVHTAYMEIYGKHDLPAARERLEIGLDCAADLSQLALSGESPTKNSTNEPESNADRWFLLLGDKGMALPALQYVPIINDYGYFLRLSHEPGKAIPVLKQVISLMPDRTVTYLDLADAYWDNGDKVEAGKNYARYVDRARKSKKIKPTKNALERMTH